MTLELEYKKQIKTFTFLHLGKEYRTTALYNRCYIQLCHVAMRNFQIWQASNLEIINWQNYYSGVNTTAAYHCRHAWVNEFYWKSLLLRKWHVSDRKIHCVSLLFCLCSFVLLIKSIKIITLRREYYNTRYLDSKLYRFFLLWKSCSNIVNFFLIELMHETNCEAEQKRVNFEHVEYVEYVKLNFS